MEEEKNILERRGVKEKRFVRKKVENFIGGARKKKIFSWRRSKLKTHSNFNKFKIKFIRMEILIDWFEISIAFNSNNRVKYADYLI